MKFEVKDGRVALFWLFGENNDWCGSSTFGTKGHHRIGSHPRITTSFGAGASSAGSFFHAVSHYLVTYDHVYPVASCFVGKRHRNLLNFYKGLMFKAGQIPPL